jgi:hypothetical protein
MAGTPKITVRVFGPGTNVDKEGSTKLLSEWIALRYPSATVYREVRLGPTTIHDATHPLDAAGEGMARLKNYYADAVILTDAELLLVEAKMECDAAANGQLDLYRRLIGSTPGLASYFRLKMVAVQLCARVPAIVFQQAQDFSIRVEIYSPAWSGNWFIQRESRRQSTTV